ncbi:NfeD family protein [Clostridium sp.]|uniref:NfeD family protein n=1 Tax=Clostridium sp. TaxID=1506 RepID=UPI002626D29F|nr:NfeD family protein [Clostridium sp.]
MVWLWLVVILLGVIIDYLSSDVLFVGFSFGALIGIVLAFFNVNVIFQFLFFSVITIFFFFYVYPKIKKKIKVDNIGTKTMEESYIGRKLTLDKDVNLSELVKFDGIYWTFKSLSGPLEKGTEVKIVGIEGNKILVKKEK